MKCKKCNSSRIWKLGKRANWRGGRKTMKQAYQCQNCGHQFTV